MSKNKRGGYGGKTTFSFEIDRFFDPITNSFLTEDEAESCENECFHQSIELDITGNAYYEPARLSGPPEDCYPEDSNIEIESVQDSNGKSWINNLTPYEISCIEEALMDYAQDDGDYDYHSYDDDCYYDDAMLDYIP